MAWFIVCLNNNFGCISFFCFCLLELSLLVPQEKIVRFQVGLLLENLENRLSNIGILESFIISLGEKRSLEDHWYISHLTIQVCILMVVYWNIMFYR